MKTPPPLEESIGMLYYSTSFRGAGGTLKRRYEDFVVEEITRSRSITAANVPLDAPFVDPEETIQGKAKKARNIHFTLQKMGLATLDVTSLLSSSLKISRHMVTYAGLKDKKAVTAQRVSIPASAYDDLKNIELSRIWIRDPSYSRRPINIGDLWGNRFTIRLREAELPYSEICYNIQELRYTPLMNYFGVQRFGVSRPLTHLVGKAVIKENFEQAVDLMLTTPSIYESRSVNEIREKIRNEGVSEHLINSLPKDLRYERMVAKSLIRRPNDFKSAFEKVPPRLQTLFVHAYQSYLFNLLLSERFDQGISLIEPQVGDFLIRLDESHTGRDDWLYASEKKLSEMKTLVENGTYAVAGTIPGYASKLPNTPQSDSIHRLLESEGVSLLDFRNTENQHLDSPGGLHLLSNLLSEITGECDDKGVVIKFELRKGSYATVVLREIMKNDPVHRS